MVQNLGHIIVFLKLWAQWIVENLGTRRLAMKLEGTQILSTIGPGQFKYIRYIPVYCRLEMIVFQSNVIKVTKKIFTRYIGLGLARIFDWRGWPNHKSKITRNDVYQNFQKRDFLWDKDIVNGGSEVSGPGLACNVNFAHGKGLKPKVKKISKIV